jgi:hypothetical protein
MLASLSQLFGCKMYQTARQVAADVSAPDAASPPLSSGRILNETMRLLLRPCMQPRHVSVAELE